MARDQRPITSEEFEAFAEAMDEQAVALAEALAADIGDGAPDVHGRRVSDGGQ